MSAGNVLQNRDARFERIKEFVNSGEFQQSNAERAKAANLNRAERKYLDRKNAKFRKTLNKLTPAQFEMIEEMANTKADEKIEELKYILDRNISALLIEVLPDMSYEELLEIEAYYSALVDEDIEKCDKLEESFKGDNNMRTKTMEKYEKDVIAACEELAQKGIKQKDAVEELLIKFPKLSKSMLMNAYKKTKAEVDKLKKEKESMDPDVLEGVETIMEIIEEGKGEDEVMVDKIIKDADKYIEDVEKEEKKVVCNGNSCSIVDAKEEKVKPEVKNPGLKVLSMKLEGENGQYTVCERGVELKNAGQLISFADEAELDKWVEEYKQVFRMVV